MDTLTENDLQIIDSLRQGDIVDLAQLPVSSHGTFQSYATPHGAVVITQTCDAVRPEKATIAVAPVERLEGTQAASARDGKVLRYVPVSSTGSDTFVDLSVIATVDKADLITLPRKPGIDPANDDDVRRFGRAIGRRFGRFPFPDEVVPWLRPLETVVQSKHDKKSPEGEAMREVVELRVEAMDGWHKPPFALTLCVIVQPGVVPAVPDDEPPPCPPELAAWLRNEVGDLRQTSAAIAARLSGQRREAPSSAAVYWLWLSLAEAWAARCTPDLRRRSPQDAAKIRQAVTGIDADLVDETDFSLYRYRRSEQLDLDHLSPPVPV